MLKCFELKQKYNFDFFRKIKSYNKQDWWCFCYFIVSSVSFYLLHHLVVKLSLWNILYGFHKHVSFIAVHFILSTYLAFLQDKLNPVYENIYIEDSLRNSWFDTKYNIRLKLYPSLVDVSLQMWVSVRRYFG